MHGVSTRLVDDLIKAMGMTGISKSRVSRLCEEIDEKVKAFLSRPIKGDSALPEITTGLAVVTALTGTRSRSRDKPIPILNTK